MRPGVRPWDDAPVGVRGRLGRRGGRGAPSAVAGRSVLRRYATPLLADPSVQEVLERRGYVVLPPTVPPSDLEALVGLGHRFLHELTEPYGELFLAAGRIADAELRSRITDAAGDLVRPHLLPLFRPHVEVLGAAFQVKPPSATSQLDPHQDSSLLDEADTLGVYCWIPLVDVDAANGWLEVVPGSHRLGNVQRTLNVPWQFEGQEEVFRRHSIGLAMPAGSVCLFDAALVHGSPPNRTDQVRFALNNFAKPRQAPMVHFFSDDATTPGMVEAWEIDVSFFLDEDIMSRPTARYRSLGDRPHVTVSLTDEQLDAVLDALAAEAATACAQA